MIRVGAITSSAMTATGNHPRDFKNGRQMAAWLGLVPKQFSSGGKTCWAGLPSVGGYVPTRATDRRGTLGADLCNANGAPEAHTTAALDDRGAAARTYVWVPGPRMDLSGKLTETPNTCCSQVQHRRSGDDLVKRAENLPAARAVVAPPSAAEQSAQTAAVKQAPIADAIQGSQTTSRRGAPTATGDPVSDIPSRSTHQGDGAAGRSAAERTTRIERAAYFRAQRRGFAPGQEVADWLAAEEEVEQSIAAADSAKGHTS